MKLLSGQGDHFVLITSKTPDRRALNLQAIQGLREIGTGDQTLDIPPQLLRLIRDLPITLLLIQIQEVLQLLQLVHADLDDVEVGLLGDHLGALFLGDVPDAGGFGYGTSAAGAVVAALA